LCHITPTPSGTSPTILRDIRLTNRPWMPVSSAFGIRVLPAVIPPSVARFRHGDTGHESDVTPEPVTRATLEARCRQRDLAVEPRNRSAAVVSYFREPALIRFP
jgi:hypothetical protein